MKDGHKRGVMKNRVLAIGKNEDVAPFYVVGADTIEVKSPSEAQEKLSEILNLGYAIIMISDEYLRLMPDRKWLTNLLLSADFPSIVSLPDFSKRSFSEELISEEVKRNIGIEVKRVVGSFSGSKEADGRTTCSFDLKYSK